MPGLAVADMGPTQHHRQVHAPAPDQGHPEYQSQGTGQAATAIAPSLLAGVPGVPGVTEARLPQKARGSLPPSRRGLEAPHTTLACGEGRKTVTPAPIRPQTRGGGAGEEQGRAQLPPALAQSPGPWREEGREGGSGQRGGRAGAAITVLPARRACLRRDFSAGR